MTVCKEPASFDSSEGLRGGGPKLVEAVLVSAHDYTELTDCEKK